jgi:hypothetical protein
VSYFYCYAECHHAACGGSVLKAYPLCGDDFWPPSFVILGYQQLQMTNTLAYFGSELMATKERFIAMAGRFISMITTLIEKF